MERCEQSRSEWFGVKRSALEKLTVFRVFMVLYRSVACLLKSEQESGFCDDVSFSFSSVGLHCNDCSASNHTQVFVYWSESTLFLLHSPPLEAKNKKKKNQTLLKKKEIKHK